MDWIWIGVVAALVILGAAVVRMVMGAQRRETLKKLGLPSDARLTPQQVRAFRAFEDTSAKLGRTFPKMSDTQRQAIARDVLRDKGTLPPLKTKLAKASTD